MCLCAAETWTIKVRDSNNFWECTKYGLRDMTVRENAEKHCKIASLKYQTKSKHGSTVQKKQEMAVNRWQFSRCSAPESQRVVASVMSALYHATPAVSVLTALVMLQSPTLAATSQFHSHYFSHLHTQLLSTCLTNFELWQYNTLYLAAFSTVAILGDQGYPTSKSHNPATPLGLRVTFDLHWTWTTHQLNKNFQLHELLTVKSLTLQGLQEPLHGFHKYLLYQQCTLGWSVTASVLLKYSKTRIVLQLNIPK